MNLSDGARAITDFTEVVISEHAEKGARKVFSLGDIRLYECPLSYITEETSELIRLVSLVDASGHLLHDGGLGGQPFWLIEAYEIYRNERTRFQKEKSDG